MRFPARSPWWSLTAVLLLALGVRGAELAVEVSVTPPKEARPGEIVTHVFTVANTGTADDLYLLELSVPEGWSYFPRKDSLFVPAGGKSFLFVNLAVPKAAPAGAYPVSLRVTSSTDPSVTDTAVTRVEVLPFWDLRISWLEPPTALQVGGRTTWRFVVENAGNSPDSYTLRAEVAGALRAGVSPGEVHLLAGEEGVATVRVEVSPRAEPGSAYSIRIIVVSSNDPTLVRELRTSGRLLPPPPELVPTSLYPRWDVSVGLELDSAGDPRFTLQGSGDIELFDYRVDASLGLSVTGLEELRLSWEGDGMGFFLHGGGIAGMFLGVSGKPLFGGEVEGLGKWRALFSPDVKGLSFTAEGTGTVIGLAWGSSSPEDLSFVDLHLRWELGGGKTLWAAVSEGIGADSEGLAWRLGGTVEDRALRLEASYLEITPGYPRLGPRRELQLEGKSLAEALPLDLSYRVTSSPEVSPPGGLVSHEFQVTVAPKTTLSPRVGLGYTRRFSIPLGVDEDLISLRVSLRGGSHPRWWSLRGVSSLKRDFAAATEILTQEVGGNLYLRAGGAEVSFGAGISATFGDGAPPPSSSFSLRFRFPGTPGSPSVSFAAREGRARFTLNLRDIPAAEGEADFSLSYMLEGGESSWDVAFSLSFDADFPFLGPTRGRITGRVFIDRDGDGAFGPGDQGIEGLLLSADGVRAMSGEGGIFAFPPLLPGRYRVEVVEPPPELSPAAPPPVVELERGREVSVAIPLSPRAWLKVVVFHDADRDGTPDSGEEGIRGVAVRITGPGVDRVEETDALGAVAMELPPGRYRVVLLEESLPERFVLTTPGELEAEVPEYGGEEVLFGAYRKPKPVVVTFAPPAARISYSPASPKVGEPVEFNGTGSEAFGAEVVDYRWEFRLGERRIEASGSTVTVVFPAPGRWTVILVVTDSLGRIGAAMAYVEVSP